MEINCPHSSHQALWKDAEEGKQKKKRCGYQLGAIVLGLLLLSLSLCVFSLKLFWSPSPGKVYDHHYKALVDNEEMDSVMEIDPARGTEVFRMGNDSDEVLEVHDFRNGLTGIRFATHKRCYIRTQTKELPMPAGLEADVMEIPDDVAPDTQMLDSRVWIPAQEPVSDRAFLLDSKIRDICMHLPIHWMHPSFARDAEFHDIEGGEETESLPNAEARGQRQTRDVLDHQPVNDYRDAGIELDQRLDDAGYCCQHCRRGYRYCRRYHEPLGGFWPYPYYYQGGRVICQIVMPCNWWIARMLGRI